MAVLKLKSEHPSPIQQQPPAGLQHFQRVTLKWRKRPCRNSSIAGALISTQTCRRCPFGLRRSIHIISCHGGAYGLPWCSLVARLLKSRGNASCTNRAHTAGGWPRPVWIVVCSEETSKIRRLVRFPQIWLWRVGARTMATRENMWNGGIYSTHLSK